MSLKQFLVNPQQYTNNTSLVQNQPEHQSTTIGYTSLNQAFDQPKPPTSSQYYSPQVIFSDSGSINQQHYNKPSNHHCPICLIGKSFFHLPNDPTVTVFCSNCKQSLFHCSVHNKLFIGMGISKTNNNYNGYHIQSCVCPKGDSFLGQSDWNSCYNN